jgi:hypothetical protein
MNSRDEYLAHFLRSTQKQHTQLSKLAAITANLGIRKFAISARPHWLVNTLSLQDIQAIAPFTLYMCYLRHRRFHGRGVFEWQMPIFAIDALLLPPVSHGDRRHLEASSRRKIAQRNLTSNVALFSQHWPY